MSFTQGIHGYIPETNHVSRVHSVAAILHLLLMVRIALSSMLNAFVVIIIIIIIIITAVVVVVVVVVVVIVTV
jgi:hypothetical protein